MDKPQYQATESELYWAARNLGIVEFKHDPLSANAEYCTTWCQNTNLGPDGDCSICGHYHWQMRQRIEKTVAEVWIENNKRIVYLGKTPDRIPISQVCSNKALDDRKVGKVSGGWCNLCKHFHWTYVYTAITYRAKSDISINRDQGCLSFGNIGTGSGRTSGNSLLMPGTPDTSDTSGDIDEGEGEVMPPPEKEITPRRQSAESHADRLKKYVSWGLVDLLD